ncbi:hypothetical protein HGRIS_005465 [Hohenbuehelia grisea]|uniref:Phosphoglycerate mutase n=1 Tax=Hohenbuehelia grisea TaxID=104357 RepID=A0ABR3JZ61_9AGAR
MPSNAYETFGPIFAHDDPDIPVTDPIPPRFGLLDDSSTRWSDLFDRIKVLNDESPSTSYKLFFLARHGQGFHNVAESKYGTPAWDAYWSKLDGDGVLVWGPDAELTDLGKGQAQAAGQAWKTELAAGIPLPGKFYCSPLTRALSTSQITFDGIIPDDDKVVNVLENCREQYGVHTCDKRRTRTYIATTFPDSRIEEGFAEDDPLWTPDDRETAQHIAERARDVLDRIFADDPEDFILVTAHGGIINGFLACLGRPSYSLATGGILPVVIKSTSS